MPHVDERVQSGWCVPCGGMFSNAAGDDPTAGIDTECDVDNQGLKWTGRSSPRSASGRATWTPGVIFTTSGGGSTCRRRARTWIT